MALVRICNNGKYMRPKASYCTPLHFFGEVEKFPSRLFYDKNIKTFQIPINSIELIPKNVKRGKDTARFRHNFKNL
jgi:hypothetical protein